MGVWTRNYYHLNSYVLFFISFNSEVHDIMEKNWNVLLFNAQLVLLGLSAGWQGFFWIYLPSENMITHMHTYVWMSMHETWSHTCTHIHACLCMEHDPTHAHIFMHVCACEGVYVCHQITIHHIKWNNCLCDFSLFLVWLWSLENNASYSFKYPYLFYIIPFMEKRRELKKNREIINSLSNLSLMRFGQALFDSV